MTWATLTGAAVVGGATPERLSGLSGWAAAAATLVTAAAAAWVTIYKILDARNERVSGDEREARVEERADKADTLAQWQAVVSQKDRDLTAVSVDRDRWKRIAEEYERLHDEDRAVRMIHGAWDFTTYEAAYQARLPVTPPPPLTAPRTPRENG